MQKFFTLAFLFAIATTSCVRHTTITPSFDPPTDTSTKPIKSMNEKCLESNPTSSTVCKDVQTDAEIAALSKCIDLTRNDEAACKGVKTLSEAYVVQNCLLQNPPDHSLCAPGNESKLMDEISRRTQQDLEANSDEHKLNCDLSIDADQRGTDKSKITPLAATILQSKGYNVKSFSGMDYPSHSLSISSDCSKSFGISSCSYGIQVGRYVDNGITYSFPVEGSSVEKAVQKLPACKIN